MNTLMGDSFYIQVIGYRQVLDVARTLIILEK
jgi:hypothetical protein